MNTCSTSRLFCGAFFYAVTAVLSPAVFAGATPGQVVAWGGQFLTNVPTGLNEVIAIAAPNSAPESDGYSLALNNSGIIVGWGGSPAFPEGLSNVIAVAASGYYCMALKNDGTVMASSGTAVPSVPVGLSNVTSIAAGLVHSLALKNDGTVVAWGDNFFGQTNVPFGLSKVRAISAGARFSLALKTNGTIVAWGDNSLHQTDFPNGLSNIITISAGAEHSMALKSNGTVVAWGYNYSGQTNVPSGLTNVVAVSAGGTHSMALKGDGTVVAWGLLPANVSVPANLSNVVAIAAGSYHSLAITIDLKVTSIERSNGKPRLGFHTFSGQNYSIEYSPDLSSSSWSNLLGTNSIPGTGQDVSLTDTNVTMSINRFYRLKLVP